MWCGCAGPGKCISEEDKDKPDLTAGRDADALRSLQVGFLGNSRDKDRDGMLAGNSARMV